MLHFMILKHLTGFNAESEPNVLEDRGGRGFSSRLKCLEQVPFDVHIELVFCSIITKLVWLVHLMTRVLMITKGFDGESESSFLDAEER